MLGETGAGTYIAYGAIVLFLLLVIALFLRTAFMFSFLLLSPAATFLRRIGLGRLVARVETRVGENGPPLP